MSSNPEYSLEIKTVQSNVFKVLVEALKEILTDTVLEITSQAIKVITLDNTHVILVHLKLDASKFEHFYCEEPRKIGINMLSFYKIIKTINNADTLTLFMKRNDSNYLGIEIENREKHTCTTYNLNLLDLDAPTITIPPVNFNNVITLPSSNFQVICRNMHNLAEHVEIKTVGKELFLSCKGDFCTQETVLRCGEDATSDENVSISSTSDEIVQGVFSLKYLVLFTKCTNLSKTVELFLRNDYPLIIRYSVATLGEIKLCLAPQTNA